MTQNGTSFCTFTVAVTKRKAQEGQPDSDFFRVTAWRQLGENCAKYLAKGRKVCVIGPVSMSTYKGKDGAERANMEVTADDVEFLTPKTSSTVDDGPPSPKGNAQNGVRATSTTAQDAEERYMAEEREAIQNEGKYVDATPDDPEGLPF